MNSTTDVSTWHRFEELARRVEAARWTLDLLNTTDRVELAVRLSERLKPIECAAQQDREIREDRESRR